MKIDGIIGTAECLAARGGEEAECAIARIVSRSSDHKKTKSIVVKTAFSERQTT